MEKTNFNDQEYNQKKPNREVLVKIGRLCYESGKNYSTIGEKQ